MLLAATLKSVQAAYREAIEYIIAKSYSFIHAIGGLIYLRDVKCNISSQHNTS